MSDPSGLADPQPTNRAEEQRNKLIFESDLNEVYLLLDFVSGRPELSFDKLIMPNMDALAAGDLNKSWSYSQIVEEITKIRFPPSPDTTAKRARNASVLLLAKDQLSRLASPARGETIAYTAMFVDAEGRAGSSSGRRRRIAHSLSPSNVLGEAQKQSGSEESDVEEFDALIWVARDTFPHLYHHAQRFRRLRRRLFVFWLVWLALTATTYWDVARGRLALQRLDQFWHDRTAMLQAHPELWNQNLCTWYSLGDARNVTRPPAPPERAGADGEKLGSVCGAFWYLDKSREEARVDLDRVFQCSDMTWAKASHIWCWNGVLAGATLATQVADGVHAVNWQSATANLSVFTSFILPMMFGLLGTVIGAFHSIQSKVRDALLAPRDLGLTVLGLAMGIAAGFVIGLFLSPSEAPVQGAGSLTGNLTLTASGLGFLAGYGS